MPEAVQLCCKFMELALTTENCVDILNLTELYVLKESKSKARAFILEHFETFAESSQYFKLNHKQLSSLLDENSLKVSEKFPNFQDSLKQQAESTVLGHHWFFFEMITPRRLYGWNFVQVLTEYKLFELVLRWIQDSKPTREQYVAELMSRLRLPLLSGEELVDKVSAQFVQDSKRFWLLCVFNCQTFSPMQRSFHSGQRR